MMQQVLCSKFGKLLLFVAKHYNYIRPIRHAASYTSLHRGTLANDGHKQLPAYSDADLLRERTAWLQAKA